MFAQAFRSSRSQRRAGSRKLPQIFSKFSAYIPLLYLILVKILSVLSCVEAWAGFLGKFPMSSNDGLWELRMELREENRQGELLPRCSCVLWVAPNVQASDIANAKAIGIVAQAVGSHLLLFPASFYLAIQSDDVMVANFGKASGLVPAVNIGGMVFVALASGRAVEDDFSYFAHDLRVLRPRNFLSQRPNQHR